MSDKRFFKSKFTEHIIDKELDKCYPIRDVVGVDALVDLLNELYEENELLKEQLDKCRRLKLSDKAIKQAYAELNRREREKHCNGDTTLTATLPHNEVVY